ncbi:MAG: carbonic anhydrase [Planctomycetota bacterium]|mgnify:FL=1
MPLDDFLSANQQFLGKVTPGRAPRDPKRAVAVVTCMDGRLTKLLNQAIGVQRGEAVMIRTAGNAILPHDMAIVRSVAASIFMLGVREVLVIGHTDCRMAGDVLPLLDGMAKLGVARDALGANDPREFFGFIPGPEQNVRAVVRQLRESPLVPSSVLVHGLMIDVESGALKVIVRGDEAPPPAPAEPPQEAVPAAQVEVPYAAEVVEEVRPRPVARKGGKFVR